MLSAWGQFGGARAVGTGPRALFEPRRRRLSAACDRTAGFAAVDALVALTVLSATVLLSLRAAEIAQRAAAAAVETRGAETLIHYLLDRPDPTLAPQAGRTRGFDWRLTATPLDTRLASLQRCARRADLRSRRSGRAYAAETVEFCLPKPGAGHGG